MDLSSGSVAFVEHRITVRQKPLGSSSKIGGNRWSLEFQNSTLELLRFGILHSCFGSYVSVPEAYQYLIYFITW